MKKEHRPLVSIVLPIYNGEAFMRESIDSCIAQTYQNWELLIVDDCSTDATAVIAKEYEAKDRRIRYYKNEVNLRLPRNLNRGFSLAKGEYLTWTSDDNYYKPTAIEKMVEVLEQTANEFVFANCYLINEKNEIVTKTAIPKDYMHAIWDNNFVGACFMYTRKVYETVGEYDPDQILCEDYDYWLRIFARYSVACIEEILYYYRVHENSLTSKNRKGQYQAVEKALLTNFAIKKDADMVDRYYLARGLHRSRSLEETFLRKYHYYPKMLFYKVWKRIKGRF